MSVYYICYRDTKLHEDDRGGAYSFVACMSRMTIDHAALARGEGETHEHTFIT